MVNADETRLIDVATGAFLRRIINEKGQTP